MKLPLDQIEQKLSQMILDKKFRGILDAGAGCLVVYEDQAADTTYDQGLEVLTNMSKVVDALNTKANHLAHGAKPKEEKKDEKEKGKDEKKKDEDKVLIKKKDK